MTTYNRKYYLHKSLKELMYIKSKFISIDPNTLAQLTVKQKNKLTELQTKYNYSIQLQIYEL